MTRPGSALEWLRGEFPEAKLTARKIASVMEAPGCVRRSVLDGAGVDTAAVSKLLGLKGDRQSPFAIARSAQFELAIMKNERAEVIALARTHLGLKLEEVRVRDLSQASVRANLNSGESMRSLLTKRELKAILSGHPDAMHLLVKPLVPLRMGSQTAWLEQDVLAFAEEGRIHVVTIRNFDSIDGRADPAKVGQTVRETAAHILSLQELIEELGYSRDRVSTSTLLILPSNLTFTPRGVVVEAKQFVDRLEAKIAQLPHLDDLTTKLDIPTPLPAVPGENASAEETAAAVRKLHGVLNALPFTFGDGCLGCPLFEACRNEAETQRLTVRLGSAVAGACGDVQSVDEALGLAQGRRTPGSRAEMALAEFLTRAEDAAARARQNAA